MQKEKSIGRNILIVVLILVTIASVCAGLFAWAKYQTTINGTATGETAKWSFKVSDGDTSTQEIEFPMTRKDNNTSVTEGKLAPGTYGELEIGIDATGTETSLTYVIEATMQNKPTNMKFYSDAERTQELTILDNKFSKGGYMKLNEVGARTEKIYWEWPFETGTTTEEKTANNKIDTEDSGKTMNMNITVTGRQVNGEPRLADLVQIGDYVNYDANSNGTYTFTSDDCTNLAGTSISATISTDEDFDSNAKSQWRVLSVDRKAGTVELMAVNHTVQLLTLDGINGFVNSDDVLKGISEIYGHGEGANGARSMKIEDVERFSSYDKTTYVNDTYVYGDEKTFTSGTFVTQIRDDNQNVIGYTDEIVTASETNKVTMKNDFYKVMENVDKYFSEYIFDMLFMNNQDEEKNIYFLDSKNIANIGNSYTNYHICIVNSDLLSGHWLFSSTGSTLKPSGAVLPVVSLNTNIQTSGQNADGVWQLKVD